MLPRNQKKTIVVMYRIGFGGVHLVLIGRPVAGLSAQPRGWWKAGLTSISLRKLSTGLGAAGLLGMAYNVHDGEC